MAGWYVLLAVSVAINVASALIRRDARRMQAEVDKGIGQLRTGVDTLRALAAAANWAEQWLPHLGRGGPWIEGAPRAWRRDVQPLINRVTLRDAEKEPPCSMN